MEGLDEKESLDGQRIRVVMKVSARMSIVDEEVSELVKVNRSMIGSDSAVIPLLSCDHAT
jgi:hypothetical protein